MSRQRLKTILNMAVNSQKNTDLTNIQGSTSDLPLLTMENIILNSEVVFEFPEEVSNLDHIILSSPTFESSSVIPSIPVTNVSDNQEPVYNTSTNFLNEIEINDEFLNLETDADHNT